VWRQTAVQLWPEQLLPDDGLSAHPTDLALRTLLEEVDGAASASKALHQCETVAHASSLARRKLSQFRRVKEQLRQQGAITLQRCWRGKLQRRRFLSMREMRTDEGELIDANQGVVGTDSMQAQDLVFAMELMRIEIEELGTRARACPDAPAVFGEEVMEPAAVDGAGGGLLIAGEGWALVVADVLQTWVNFHLQRAGSPRRLESWSDDLKDSAILALLYDELNLADQRASIAYELMELFSENAPASNSRRLTKMGSKDVLAAKDLRHTLTELFLVQERMRGAGGQGDHDDAMIQERASLVCRHLSGWSRAATSAVAPVRSVVVRPQHIYGLPDGMNIPHMQHAVAQLFLARAGAGVPCLRLQQVGSRHGSGGVVGGGTVAGGDIYNIMGLIIIRAY
jgi:hypothetical protein